MDSKTQQMVIGWLGSKPWDERVIEATAKYMRDTLRIGPMVQCRNLIYEAIQAVQS